MHRNRLIYILGLFILSGCTQSSVRRPDEPANPGAIVELRAESARLENALLKTQDSLQVLRDEEARLSAEKKTLFEGLTLLRQKGLQEERRVAGVEAQLAALDGKLKELERKSKEQIGNPATAGKSAGKGVNAEVKESRETARSGKVEAPRASLGAGDARPPLEAGTRKEKPLPGASDKGAKSSPAQLLGLARGSVGKILKGDGGLGFWEVAFLGISLLVLAVLGWFSLRWLSRHKRSPSAVRAKSEVKAQEMKAPLVKRTLKVSKAKSPAKSLSPRPDPKIEAAMEASEEEPSSTQVISGAAEEEFASTQVISRGGKQGPHRECPPAPIELDPDQTLLAELEELMGEKFER
jgi:hypothetical protein